MFTGTIGLKRHWALEIKRSSQEGKLKLPLSPLLPAPCSLLPTPLPLRPLPPLFPAACPVPYATNPERRALTAAWVRSSAHNLFRILRTWVFTVPTVI